MATQHEGKTASFDPTPIPVDQTWGLRFIKCEADVISGFKSAEAARDWLNSSLCKEWLKTRGFTRTDE
jgi:hypothetical protein